MKSGVGSRRLVSQRDARASGSGVRMSEFALRTCFEDVKEALIAVLFFSPAQLVAFKFLCLAHIFHLHHYLLFALIVLRFWKFWAENVFLAPHLDAC